MISQLVPNIDRNDDLPEQRLYFDIFGPETDPGTLHAENWLNKFSSVRAERKSRVCENLSYLNTENDQSDQDFTTTIITTIIYTYLICAQKGPCNVNDILLPPVAQIRIPDQLSKSQAFQLLRLQGSLYGIVLYFLCPDCHPNYKYLTSIVSIYTKRYGGKKTKLLSSRSTISTIQITYIFN